MKIDDELLINRFGQSLIDESELSKLFDSYDLQAQRTLLIDVVNLIIQSKVTNEDISVAILESRLKPSYTPCVMLRKGVADHNLYKIVQLPENELPKAFRLFINLFKIGYKRRFEQEKGNLTKWWYWDLSDNKKIEAIMNKIP